MMINRLAIILGLFTLTNTAIVNAETVSNLEAVSTVIKHQEGKQFFDEQMNGIAANKKFGLLPQDLDEHIFTEWIAPNEHPDFLTLVGAKAWGKENMYIGVACFARNSKDASYSEQYKDTDCSEDFSLRRAKNLYLGLFQWKDKTFQPIAKTLEPLNINVSWQNSNLLAPNNIEDNEADLLPQSYSQLDLAPYRIAPNITAFGVRANFNEMYAGGGAYFEALQLFMVKNGQIINILSEPMYYYQNIAGDWHEDGTRDHDITEGKNILMVLNSQTNGYYDLRIKSIDSKWRQDFIWSTELGRYVVK